MSSSISFKNFILEQLRDLENISCKPMMGEFLFYYNGILFGGVYDDKFLIKKTNSNEKYNLSEVIPYPNAKPMYFVEDVDNANYLEKVVKDTCKEL